jgi:hypothetical protein
MPPMVGVIGALAEAGTASWPETVRLMSPGLRATLAELAFRLQNGRFSCVFSSEISWKYSFVESCEAGLGALLLLFDVV